MFLKRLSRIRRTITFRLILWYSAFFILSTTFLFTLAYVLLSSSVRQKDREEIHEKLGEYAAQYRAGGLEALRTEVTLEERSAKGNALFVRVRGPLGATLFLNTPERWGDFDLAQLETVSARGGEQPVLLRTRDGKKALEIESTPLADGLLLQVGRSTEEREDLLESFREIFTGIMIPVVILGIAGGSFLAYRTLRPVRSLIHAVRSVSTGRMDARVPATHTGDELDELVILFNAMLEKIENLIKGMRGSLDTVAHDLRTPLARLRGTAEMALRADQKPDVYSEALADCVEEADQILTMLNTLMDISEAETGAMKLQLEEVNVPRLMEDAVELYAHVAEDKNVSLGVAPSEELTMPADRNRMRQVLANLLDNAIKYTPPGGRVDLRAFRQDGQAVITVRDTGAGIAPEDAPKIWDRLYRGDRSRSQRGLGLGLSLVKAVVRAHNGRIEVTSAPGGGSLFTIYLPTPSSQGR
jgi:signal transduction histidine kinase